jgi:hypothetical protein
VYRKPAREADGHNSAQACSLLDAADCAGVHLKRVLEFGHFSADANGVYSYQPGATPQEKRK